jgi:hypothetical protein
VTCEEQMEERGRGARWDQSRFVGWDSTNGQKLKGSDGSDFAEEREGKPKRGVWNSQQGLMEVKCGWLMASPGC